MSPILSGIGWTSGAAMRLSPNLPSLAPLRRRAPRRVAPRLPDFFKPALSAQQLFFIVR
jgi:hypothetical protein